MAHVLVFKLTENKFYIHQTIFSVQEAARITNAFINKSQEELDDLLKNTIMKIKNKSNWVKQYPILFLWEIRAISDLFLTNLVEDEMKQFYMVKYGKNNVNNDKFEIDYSTMDEPILGNKKNIIRNIKNISINMTNIMDNYDKKITDDILDRHYQILVNLETRLKEINDNLTNLIK